MRPRTAKLCTDQLQCSSVAHYIYLLHLLCGSVAHYIYLRGQQPFPASVEGHIPLESNLLGAANFSVFLFFPARLLLREGQLPLASGLKCLLRAAGCQPLVDALGIIPVCIAGLAKDLGHESCLSACSCFPNAYTPAR